MKTIGPFELLDEIGRGAMGVVYRAKDPAIGRLVAIKLIRMDSVSDAPEDEFLRGRLLREAQSAGVLSHPGIVTIYQVAKEGDTAYIAMEYVNGPTLEKLIGPGSPVLSRQAVRDILTQTATALDYAHRRGVVHRDVKPANIMIGEDGQTKICDFGVAKVFGGQRTVTRAGYVLGTPYYMSAEQIQGKPLDGRADQYSLAVIAYRILTGVRPFDAETMETLLFQIIFGESQAAHELNPTLSPRSAEMLRKGLAKKAEERFANCKEFAEAVLRACDLNPDWSPPTPGAAPASYPPREPEPERQAPAVVQVKPVEHPPAAPPERVEAGTEERCRNCGGQVDPGVGLCKFCASFGAAALPPQPVIAGPPPPPPLRPPPRPPPPPPPFVVSGKPTPPVTSGHVPVPKAGPRAPPLETRETGLTPTEKGPWKWWLIFLIVIAAVAVATLAYWNNRPAEPPPIVSEVREPPVAPPAPAEPEQKQASKAPEPEPAPEIRAPLERSPRQNIARETKKVDLPVTKPAPAKPESRAQAVVTPPPPPAKEVTPKDVSRQEIVLLGVSPKEVSRQEVPPKEAPRQEVPPKEAPRQRVVLPPDRYRGPLEGKLTCPGEFAASGAVVIDDSRGCSGKLPDVAAELRVMVNPPDVSVIELPSAANKWQRLVLRMPNRPVPSVTILWELK